MVYTAGFIPSPSTNAAQSTFHIESITMHTQVLNVEHPPNIYYENDIRYTFQLCYWVIKPIGIYPLIYENASKYERALSVLQFIVCCCLIQFAAIPVSHYFIHLDEKDLELVAPVVFCFSMQLKYICLCLKSPAFRRCVKHVERDWKMLQDQDHRDIMIEYTSTGRNIVILCMSFICAGGTAYHAVMPLLSQKTKMNSTRPLAYPGNDFFFDIQRSPIYEMIFCSHLLFMLVAINVLMGGYGFAIIFTSHACGQIKIQMVRLKNLTNQWASMKKGDDRLAVVVRDHAKILSFVKKIEEAFREICLIEAALSMIFICFAGYYVMMEWQNSDAVAILTYFTLLTSFTFNIFIFCYIGEILSEQCSQIGAASYDIDWYNLPVKKAHDLILVSSISQYPPKLTAGKLIELSLNTFTAVLKSSVAYLNLLRTVT